MIKEGDLSVLNQLIKNLEDSYAKLKKFYDKKDSENFNKIKIEIIKSQREILRMAGQNA